ncbi:MULTISPECIES: Rne/Rng family ribonuclease [Cytobacillus]|uniref:Rne/Rng family ribonuclease n=1 Tax=Cytobacillus TaxID=2675230 RepID=UPI00203AB2DB|nr:Rne/Rng family ribonuclease [Cytobacillus kochii]MCM3323222.1 Rne/Rng family ribonuclease [Cytobacillus kochii]MCM3345617.1 Rne/Rng family ribonuclease [Cytobacillus kochii]MDM5208641.1 Rne/Rng family ribonuclease [Cytobacillus kochii]
MKRLVINTINREKRYALLDQNEVEELYIEPLQLETKVGNIYLGIVEKVMPGLNALFVNIGEEKSGFLHKDKLQSYALEDDDKKEKRNLSSFVHQGERLLVQVEKDQTGTKGPRLTGIVELQGNYMVYLPFGNYLAVSKKITNQSVREQLKQNCARLLEAKEGLVIRTAAKDVDMAVLEKELTQLRVKYQQLHAASLLIKRPGVVQTEDQFLHKLRQVIQKMKSGEVIVDDATVKKQLQPKDNVTFQLHTNQEAIFTAYGLEREIEKALKRIVWLDNGAYLIFDETEALAIIDVNTGKFSGKHQLQDTVLKTNELAAREVARQIRIRDLAGMILIDFISMEKEQDRIHILSVIKEALATDERQIKVIGFTPLGILQLTRKKTKVSLSEALQENCTVCHGTGKVLRAETVAFRLERELWSYRTRDEEAVLIEVTRDVVAVYTKEELQQLEESCAKHIVFDFIDRPKPSYHIKRFGPLKEMQV